MTARASRSRPAKALADAQLRRNLGKATTAIRVKRANAVAELDDWAALRDAGGALKAHVMATLPEQLERLEERVTAAGGTVHWARDGAEANAIVARIARENGTDEVIKVKSLLSDEIGLNEALALRGVHAIETDLAELIVQLGDDEQSHILVPAIHRNRAEIAALFERTIAEGQELGLEPTRDRRGGPPAPAREVPQRPGRRLRRELRDRRDRLGRRRRVRGQRPHVHDAAAGPGHADGDREGAAGVARPRDHAPAAAALLDRGADEPVHVDLDRRARGRRPARVPPRPDRRGPDRRARRPHRPPGAALHPLLGLPELLPGLLAHRRPRLRVGLPRPDRRDPHPAARGPRPGADAAVGVLAVRRVLRGLPGQDRHPDRARPPARAGRQGGQVALEPRAPRDGRAREGLRLARALRARAAARAGGQRAARPPPARHVGVDGDARAPRRAAAVVPGVVGGRVLPARRRTAGADTPRGAAEPAPAPDPPRADTAGRSHGGPPA